MPDNGHARSSRWRGPFARLKRWRCCCPGLASWPPGSERDPRVNDNAEGHYAIHDRSQGVAHKDSELAVYHAVYHPKNGYRRIDGPGSQRLPDGVLGVSCVKLDNLGDRSERTDEA